MDTKSPEIFDLTLPQKSLNHGSIPKYVTKDAPAIDVVSSNLRLMLRNPQAPQDKPVLWNSGQEAFEQFILETCGEGKTLRIATWKPSSLNLSHNFAMVEISRDPQDWTKDTFANCDLILIQNPTLWDGYYLPEEIFANAMKMIQSFDAKIPLFIDQRNLVFSWEEVTPGDARSLTIKNPYAILSSTHPILAPQLNREVAWTVSNVMTEASKAFFAVEDLSSAAFMINSFRTKQGPFAAEFQKVMLVVKEALKRISAEVQLLAKSMGFRISHWPTSGLYLRLECGSELNAARVQKTFLDHGIKVQNGKDFGDASSLMLCYSMHLSQCDRLLKRLSELRATS